MSEQRFELFYVTALKRHEGKIIGIVVMQHKAVRPVKVYMEISHVYHTQFTERQYVFLVSYVVKEEPLEVSSFRLRVEKVNEDYVVVIPDSVEQRQGLISLPEHVERIQPSTNSPKSPILEGIHVNDEKNKEVELDVDMIITTASRLSQEGQQKHNAAGMYYKLVLDKEPHNENALLGAASFYASTGKLTEAKIHYDLLLAQNPNNINALVGNGIILSMVGKYDSALQFFQKVLSIQPKNTFARNNVARIYGLIGKFADSLNIINEVLKDEPKNEEALSLKQLAEAALNN